jgi:hypothetical protein
MNHIRLLLLLLLLLLPACIYGQNRYDIIIDELMIDPAPSAGLPPNEWIELRNTSSQPVNLQHWRIGDLNGRSGPIPAFILQPDSFVIVCAANAVAAMVAFGTTISVTGFPSLDNDVDQLFLQSANGQIMHAVSYTSTWYRNDVKKEGGWSLEMTDTQNPCSGGSNWKASTSQAGGTPGRKNATDAINKDDAGPQLLRAYTTDSITLVLIFDEPLDSLTGATPANYSIDGGLSVIAAMAIAPLFNEVQLKTNTMMQVNTVYTITAGQVRDCSNNSIGSMNKVRSGLPADPSPGEWIINEILFNPRPSAFDYAEFYNNSHKILDASRLYIANRNSIGSAGSIKVLSDRPFYIFPGDHIVVTEDPGNLASNYLVKHPELVLPISSLPSLADDAGEVITMNYQGIIVDEVRYSKGWHFKLIDNDEGIALERIDPGGSSQEPTNWHSAASAAGHGTPTYKNSQHKQPHNTIASIQVQPMIFSPDNDGRDDIATIQYKVNEPGYVANITVFDAAGRPVRYLVRNATLGLNGYWNWDGLNDNGQRLPIGIYIIFTGIFNLQGKKDIFRNTIVLIRNFK